MTKPKFSKEKQTSIKKWQKLCDDVYSLFIRLRDSDDWTGIGQCITCGNYRYFGKADCGHYIKRQYLPTRYDDKNCNLQCKNCNNFEQGNDERYAVAIDKKYGAGTSETLKIKKHNKSELDRFEYSLLIKHYQFKILELMQVKQFQLSPHYLRLMKERILK